MKGLNRIVLNPASIQEAFQLYLEDQLSIEIKVENVLVFNGDTSFNILGMEIKDISLVVCFEIPQSESENKNNGAI